MKREVALEVICSILEQCLNMNAGIIDDLSPVVHTVCQMCDRGVDETMVYVVLECDKYNRKRTKRM